MVIPKKRCLGPQNGPESLGPEKLEKIAKMKIVCEPVGRGGWPLISTWIKEETITLTRTRNMK
jgi:hypothetical protein